MTAKIKVYAKERNKTALGVVRAYTVLNPGVDLKGLRSAFPNDLNSEKGVKENFILDNGNGAANGFDGYLRDEGDAIVLADGSKVIVAGSWTGRDLANLLAKASSYDIVCADQPECPSPSVVGNGYSLEFLDGFVPQEAAQVAQPFVPQGAPRGVNRFGPWIVAAVVLIAVVVWLLSRL